MAKKNGKKQDPKDVREKLDAELSHEMLGQIGGRHNLPGMTGSYVERVDLPMSGISLLIRRVPIEEKADAGIWDKPITAIVRSMMAFGNQGALRLAGNLEDYYETARALARVSVIAPTEQVMQVLEEYGGDTRLILPEMCKPLFVAEHEEPDDDQVVLVPAEKYQALQNEVAGLQLAVDRQDDSRSKLEEKLKRLDEAEATLATWTAFHTADLATLAARILDHGPGALKRYRKVTAGLVGDVP